MSIIIVVAVCALAYSNGANDNFKGVATLFGSGTVDYRRALAWATVTTLAGSLLALVLASGLVGTFKGKGLVPDSVTTQQEFLLAVSIGAATTILLATVTGLPVSTTHTLTGALIGAGLVAASGQIKWSGLLSAFLVPLLLSPMLSMLLTLVVYPLLRFTRQRIGITAESCVCIGSTYEAVSQSPDRSLVLLSTGMQLQTGEISECVQRYRGQLLGLDAGSTLDVFHFLSSGAVGFARGLNDAPKIVALLVAGQTLHPQLGLALVSFAMAMGAVLNGRRVAETMSNKITRMNSGQGFTANLVTSTLVVLASCIGLPVSTTHVSVGSLFGIGMINGTVKRDMAITILLSWLTTLPLGALFAATTYWLVGRLTS